VISCLYAGGILIQSAPSQPYSRNDVKYSCATRRSIHTVCDCSINLLWDAFSVIKSRRAANAVGGMLWMCGYADQIWRIRTTL